MKRTVVLLTALTIVSILATFITAEPPTQAAGKWVEAAVAPTATALSPRAYLPIVEKGCSTSVSFYQETDHDIVLEGTWSSYADSHAAGGAYVASDTIGDAVHFTFCGDSVTLYRRMDTDGGVAEVSIDGVYRQTLLFYFLERRWQVPAVIDNLGNGPHTITMRGISDPHSLITGRKIYIDAFAVPNPYTATSAQQQALAQFNWYRSVAGIPLVKMSGALNLAAQAHSDYIRINGWNSPGPHGEDPAYPGFTGYGSSDRGSYFGYDWTWGAGESMHWLGDTTAAIDEIMAAPFHRGSLMFYDLDTMGTGLNTDVNRSDALYSGGQPVSVTARILYTYPADGQVDVPNSWRDIEVPDILPPGTPKPVGYPISLYMRHPTLNMDATINLAELRDANRQLVPIFIWPYWDTKFFPIHLIPKSPMALNATYTVRVAGLDGDGVPFDQSWSFTTTTVCRWVFCE